MKTVKEQGRNELKTTILNLKKFGLQKRIKPKLEHEEQRRKTRKQTLWISVQRVASK
jgi:hypothetical protein